MKIIDVTIYHHRGIFQIRCHEIKIKDKMLYLREYKESELVREFVYAEDDWEHYEAHFIGENKRLKYDIEKPIEDLELTIRSRNCLHGKGLYKVSQLIEYTELDLLQIEGLGKKSLNEIKDVLAEKGLTLLGE